MMPGWWDQNKESLEALAQTATRMVNPQFDNQLALMQNIRQNPANIQTVVDTAYLNPQMFAQMYGERGLQQIQQMARPSSTATIENTSRDIMAKPIDQVGTTVAERGALAAANVPSPERLKIEKTSARAGEVNLEETLRNITRTRDLQALTDPVELNLARNILTAVEANPILANIDVAGLVAKQMNGTMTPQDMKSLEALLADENMQRYYYSHLGIATNREQAENADKRQDARLAAQLNLTQQQIDRGALDDARALIQRANAAGLPLTMTDAVNYLTPGKDNLVTAAGRTAVERLGQIDLTAGRLKMFQSFVDDFANVAKNPNKEVRTNGLTAITATLSSLMGGAPVEIMSADPEGNWWSSDTAFRLYGRKLNGSEIQALIRDPNQIPVFEQKALAEKTDSPVVIQRNITQITNDMINGENNGIFASQPEMKAQLQNMLNVWQNRLAQIQAAQNTPRRTR